MSASFDQAYQWHRAGRLDQARAAYDALLKAQPGNAELLHLSAVVALQQGRRDEAVALAQSAVALAPDHPKAWNTLGNALHALGRTDAAVDAFRRAAANAPDLVDPVYNLAVLLAEQGDDSAAQQAFEQAGKLAPSDPRPWNNLGVLHLRARRFDQAEAALRRALTIRADFHDASANMGILLCQTLRPGQAVAVLRGLPETPAVLANLGNALEMLGEMEEAVAVLRRAAAAAPGEPKPQQNLLVTIPFMDSWSAEQVAEEHRAFGRRWNPVFAASRRPFLGDKDPDRILRIGYVSPNLCRHVLAQYVQPLFRAHHRDQVHVSVYAHVPAPDAVTESMRQAADAWTFIDAMTDDQAAQRIRDDRIDVLIHPMGHWSENRMLIFARKPAPVQISYLCNSPTTGLDCFDGLVVDRALDFDDSLSAYCVEDLIHLPGAFQAADYTADVEIGPPPCLTNGFVTFGSFNNPAKLSTTTMELWAAALNRVPNSRMLIKGGGVTDPNLNGRLQRRLQDSGIDPARIKWLERVASYDDHLRMFNQIDIVLDTAPFTGGCTSLDALWMGVPVVSLTGPAVYGRFTTALAHHIGVGELSARNAVQYAAIAADLAAAPDRLTAYRGMLRQAMKASPIMDFDGHCRDLENAFRALWRKFCASNRT